MGSSQPTGCIPLDEGAARVAAPRLHLVLPEIGGASLLARDFRPLGSSPNPELSRALAGNPQPLSGYTLGALLAWDPVFHYEWLQTGPESVLISCGVEGEPRQLLQPVGAFGAALQQEFVAAAARSSYPLKIYGVSKGFLGAHPDFAARFSVTEDRDGANYVYTVEDLATLAGRKLAPKRNHLAQAAREYRWTARAIGPDDVPACLDLVRTLHRDLQAAGLGSPSAAREVLACESALTQLVASGLRRMVIEVAGRTVAFSLWDALDSTTAEIHFERALRSYKGLYQVVNHEAAKTLFGEGFGFINREEDLGDEGLRKSKLSYHPVRLEPSHTLTFRL
jgi:uncharacterized protein